MIRIFYGDDRVTISEKIKKEFGEEYEVFEGEGLKIEDLPSIFFGASLFSDKRKIEQVIYNLIGNAINYIGNDKTIIVNLSKKR